MTTTVPPGLAELTEIMAYADFATSAPTSVREALGLGVLHVGSARALAIREDPSHFFNRAGGFGADSPITVDDLVRVCDFYRERGVSQGSLMIAPPLLPPDWAAIAAKLGLAENSRFIKLGCDIETLPTAAGLAPLDPGWRVGVVEAHQAQEWATVMVTTFGFTTPDLIEMAASCAGKATWRQYAVWAGERIVAVGSVFLNGECADMFGGATLPERAAVAPSRRCSPLASGRPRVRAVDGSSPRTVAGHLVRRVPRHHRHDTAEFRDDALGLQAMGPNPQVDAAGDDKEGSWRSSRISRRVRTRRNQCRSAKRLRRPGGGHQGREPATTQTTRPHGPHPPPPKPGTTASPNSRRPPAAAVPGALLHRAVGRTV